MLHRLILPLSQNISRPDEERLARALESVRGVVVVFINPQTEMIYLVYRERETSKKELDAVIEASGFYIKPRLHSKNLKFYTLQA